MKTNYYETLKKRKEAKAFDYLDEN